MMFLSALVAHPQPRIAGSTPVSRLPELIARRMQTRGLGELAELLMTLPREFWPFLRRTLPRFPARQPFERFKLFVIADELLC